MKFVVINAHLPAYKPLADLTTYGNRADYCKRHGYTLKVQTDGFELLSCHPISFGRLKFMRDELNGSGYDWAWCSGVDTLNTNFNIRLEDLADPAFHVIASCEWCGPFQADSFLVRNSPQGIGWLDAIIAKHEQYKNNIWVEQAAIIDSLGEFDGLIKLLPQRAMNSYDYTLYRKMYPDKPGVINAKDFFGNDGQWYKGDFLIHWPGLPLTQRLELARKYLKLVVK